MQNLKTSIFKKLVKGTTPPFIWESLRSLIIKDLPSYTYEGIFSSFEEVFRAYPLAEKYHNEDSFLELKRSAQLKYEKLLRGEIPQMDFDLSRLNIITSFLAGIGKELNILDIGGGPGTSYIDCLFSCPNIIKSYHVIELEQVKSFAESLFKNEKKLTFASAIEEKDRFDFVIFGSSLQYFENYNEILNKAFAVSPEYIGIFDQPISSRDSFICAQVNMIDRVIPRWIFAYDEIVKTFKERGYDLVYKAISFYPDHNFDNYDDEFIKQSELYNLVFKFNKTNRPI